MTTMTTSQSSSKDEEKAAGEAPSPPVVPDPVVPVIPSQCLAGHPRVRRPDKRGRNHQDPDHLVWSIAPVGQLTSRIVDVPISTATEGGLSTATEGASACPRNVASEASPTSTP